MFNFGPQSKPQKVVDINDELIPKDKLKPEYKWQVNIKHYPVIDLHNEIIPTISHITNERNLPDLLYRRLCKRNYFDSANSFLTGSGLAINKKQFFFKSKYKDAQITDANEMVASMIGTAVHDYMEGIAKPGEIIEKRFSIEICGKVLSAQLDHYADGILSDYKVTKAWQKAYRQIKKETGVYEQDPYVLQANFIAYMLRQQGYPVLKSRLIFIYKDYDQYVYKPNYPHAQSEEEWIPLWDDEKVLAMLEKKVKELTNINEDNVQLYICSDKEMWREPTEYTLKKVGSSRSLPKTKCNTVEDIEKRLKQRLLKNKQDQAVPIEWYDYTEEQKLKYAESEKGHLYVEAKVNEPTYCMTYCPGRHYCAQYQEWYCGNKKYKIKVKKGSKEKTIEMYGKDFMEARNKVAMIHPSVCIVEHPKAIDVKKSFFGDMQ